MMTYNDASGISLESQIFSLESQFDWNWQRVGVNWLSNDHLGPLSNGNAAPVGLQWTSAFNLDVPRVHLAKLRRLVSPSGCHRTSLALNWLYKTLLEWV